jgi:hypothetical protein
MQTTCVAKAKLVYRKEKEVYRIVIAFNVSERTKKGDLKFPVEKKCDFVSGDISYESLEKDVNRIVAQAKEVLRTDNIVFVK